jgi:hypothetical protein
MVGREKIAGGEKIVGAMAWLESGYAVAEKVFGSAFFPSKNYEQ